MEKLEKQEIAKDHKGRAHQICFPIHGVLGPRGRTKIARNKFIPKEFDYNTNLEIPSRVKEIRLAAPPNATTLQHYHIMYQTA